MRLLIFCVMGLPKSSETAILCPVFMREGGGKEPPRAGGLNSRDLVCGWGWFWRPLFWGCRHRLLPCPHTDVPLCPDLLFP